ncbi:Hypothetical protein C900_01437 [Fulvivirga imtechensis AK7]|uniref:Tryptophan-rich sensory protein n=1 Tax=Fulvivirga imtechensis AK7 TaxID=1237149 RepID=L8K2Z2_9BACT|nr:hypothetical protein [Fulvivirga imtechensis]ELR73827.1 Hypothetical protein C900_01437 [Fulvivirga imtechensis AK7]
MMNGEQIISKFRNRWKLLLLAEAGLYAAGLCVLTYFLTTGWFYSLIAFVATLAITLLLLRPWAISLSRAAGYIDQKLGQAEFSTGLLLQQEDGLSDLALLQRHRVLNYLSKELKHLFPPHHLTRAAVALLVCVLASVLVQQSGFDMDDLTKSGTHETLSGDLTFQPEDTTQTKTIHTPVLESKNVYLKYPAYTGLKSRNSQEMNISAVEGSMVTWSIGLNQPVSRVVMESGNSEYDMQQREGLYSKSITLQASGFYNFRYFDDKGKAYVSPVYKIEALADEKPEVTLEGIDQFTVFEHNNDMRLRFSSNITDDFGISQAHIIATVSKGTGESVKFREEKLNFDAGFKAGHRSLYLQKTVDLDQLQMTPGDELYFYVEAIDNKQPQPNIVRSETYFAVIRDTAAYQLALEGSLGVDLMPEYFRSQRQLIIDTEKLIKDKPKISKKEFNSASNELGFDQKALRLKYGQFMGEENESGIAIGDSEAEAAAEQHEHGEDADPLAEYTHDHDGDNEHNLVTEGGGHEHDEDDDEDPLHGYIHAHDDPEEATLYTTSVRGKLRQAMNEMWDAELYLRLFQPEKSLPYQYKALKLIQEIKNHARIYVHRIGFDPPPVKEDKRLTGDLSEVDPKVEKERFEVNEPYPALIRSLERIGELLHGPLTITPADQALFDRAGKELATIAIEQPGRYLQALEYLKKLSSQEVERNLQRNMLLEVQGVVRSALPQKPPNPSLKAQSSGELDKIFLEELERLQHD